MPERAEQQNLLTRARADAATAAAAFTLTELLVISALVLALFVLLLPSLKHGRDAARGARRDGIAATLTRIERAKGLYAAARRLKAGTPITADELVREGYLEAGDISAPATDGIRYVVGRSDRPSPLPSHLSPYLTSQIAVHTATITILKTGRKPISEAPPTLPP